MRFSGNVPRGTFLKTKTMNKNIFFEKIDPFDFNPGIFSKIENLIQNENKTKGDLSFIFCSDDYLLDINKKYLNHDFYTDVITFDYSENNILSGDVFISIDRVKENAGTFNVPFEEELQRVMIHGVLHLAGYKDKTDKEKKQMTDKENFYLK